MYIYFQLTYSFSLSLFFFLSFSLACLFIFYSIAKFESFCIIFFFVMKTRTNKLSTNHISNIHTHTYIHIHSLLYFTFINISSIAITHIGFPCLSPPLLAHSLSLLHFTILFLPHPDLLLPFPSIHITFHPFLPPSGLFSALFPTHSHSPRPRKEEM